MLIQCHVKRILIGLFTFVTLEATEWQIDLLGDAALLECTTPDYTLGEILDIDSKGICGIYESPSLANILVAATAAGISSGSLAAFGASLLSNVDTTFNIGGAARCSIKGAGIGSPLEDFCNNIVGKGLDIPVTADVIWGVFSTGAMGALLDDTEQEAKDRKFPSGLTMNAMYGVNGGKQINNIIADPQGATAIAYRDFDKAGMVLGDLALKMSGTGTANLVKLPPTMMDKISKEEKTVRMESLLQIDWPVYVKDSTYSLKKIYKNIPVGSSPSMISLAEYAKKEKVKAKTFFTEDNVALSTYKENEKKIIAARLASDLLIKTSKKGYISDTSEARKQFIADEQKIAFTYASIIQNEEDKKLKLQYALEWKSAQESFELMNQLVAIKASIFRDDLAKDEIARLLTAADSTITY